MSIKAMKQALEALDGINDEDCDKDFLNLKQFVRLDMAIQALRTAIQQAEGEPVGEPRARVELMKTGGNAGLSTHIIELDIATRERLRPGDLLYTHPAPGEPDEQFERAAKIIWDAGWKACRDTELVGTNAQEFAWGCVAADVSETLRRAMLTAAQAQKDGG